MKRLHVYYSGRVQGVGFRYTAVDCALKHKIGGSVRNMPDSRVEVIAEADQATLHSFLNSLESIMSRYIQKKEISWEPGTGEFSSFTVKY